MMKIETNPYHRVIACPSKLYIMDKLHKVGRLDIQNIINDNNVFRPSVTRHIQELLNDHLVNKYDNDFLVITDEGEKVVRHINAGKEYLQTVEK